jgi:MEMO1 family protein
MSQACRPAAVAGLFYPDNPAQLRAVVDGYLSAAEARPSATGRLPKAIVVPHAGYIYSGPIAASAYALLRGARGIDRVVLVGPPHRVAVHGLASAGADAFATPLGEVAVDHEAMAAVRHTHVPRAHAQEHSLEVQLPFLQRLLPGARIVPLLAGDASPEDIGKGLSALWGGPETLIVVSSDLSHYLPYEQARERDADTARRLTALDQNIDPDCACGSVALDGLAWAARAHGLEPELLDLRNSGDTAGDHGRVVGYAALAYWARAEAARA